jgi:ATP-dependent 26S proteasome regulatory subunit
MSSVPHNSIIVMEDIDHLFESVTDSNATENSATRLTMSGLLNVLDGIQGQEGSSKFLFQE